MAPARYSVVLVTFLALSACATMPPGPSVLVLPPAGKPFEVFQIEDLACRSWAAQQSGALPADIVNQNLTGGAAIGTLLGAGLGAAIGAASGNAGAGAAIGAGSGLIGGTAAASGPAYAAGWEVQRRYDNAYQQCMYAKGNRIPDGVQAPRPTVWIPPPPPPGVTQGALVPPPPNVYAPAPVYPQ
jgi:hypothetical protein